MALSKKQELFCKEYLIDLNATQAYKRAGYSVKSDNAAAVEASKLLRNPKVETKYGFEPGANWETNPDSPHFQVKGDFTDLFLFGHATLMLRWRYRLPLTNRSRIDHRQLLGGQDNGCSK